MALASCYSLRANPHKVHANLQFLTIENPDASAAKLASLATQQLAGGGENEKVEPHLISNERLVQMLINVRVVYAAKLALRIISPPAPVVMTFSDDMDPNSIATALTNILNNAQFINQAEASFLKDVGKTPVIADCSSWSSYWCSMIKHVVDAGAAQLPRAIKKEPLDQPPSARPSASNGSRSVKASDADAVDDATRMSFDRVFNYYDAASLGGVGAAVNVMDILCIQDALQLHFKSFAMLLP